MRGSLVDKGCLTSVQCPATGTGYIIQIPLIDSTCIPVDSVASSTANSVG